MITTKKSVDEMFKQFNKLIDHQCHIFRKTKDSKERELIKERLLAYREIIEVIQNVFEINEIYVELNLLSIIDNKNEEVRVGRGV